MRVPVAAAFVFVAAGAATAQDPPDGVGVDAPSGSVFTSEITYADADDYVFDGFPGRTLRVAVKAANGDRFSPSVEVIPPGGRPPLTDEDGLAAKFGAWSATAKVTLDATGVWKVRVRGRADMWGLSRSTGAYAVSIRYGRPSLPPLPEIVRGFERTGSIAGGGDTDEFPFEGRPGQTISARLTVPRADGLDATLRLVRPDGTIAAVAGDGSAGRLVALAQVLDAEGTWILRVTADAGAEFAGTTGAYAIAMRTGTPTEHPVVADANGQYRFALPVTAGARVGWTLTSNGATPTFNSLLDPLGRPVPGVQDAAGVASFVVPAGTPLGDATLVFDAPADPAPSKVRLVRKLVLPKPAARRIERLSAEEPDLVVGGVSPSWGAPGTLVTVAAGGLVDGGARDGAPELLLGPAPLVGVELAADGASISGRVPDGLPPGVYDVVVRSTTGQPAVLAGAFARLPSPVVERVEPPVVAASAAGAVVTLTGRHFRPGWMELSVDGAATAVDVVDETTIRFTAPPHAAGLASIDVRDFGSGLSAAPEIEYVAVPTIGRVSPVLVPLLSDEPVTLEGAAFSPTDRVLVETATSGVFEDVTATRPTFVDPTRHRFAAPVRPKGEYRVFVDDSSGRSMPRTLPTLSYFSFADATAASGLDAVGATDASTSALADLDGDGDLDLVLSRSGGPEASATSETRVLLNDGHGAFADATVAMLPPAGADDWRADRVAASDIDRDGFADLVLTTNSVSVPPSGRSHTRILMNEARGGAGPAAAGRVLRDRTLDVMAPPRVMRKFVGGTPYVSDDWRGLDVWVGDLDESSHGPPSILLTHTETKDGDFDVSCGSYCFSPYAVAYPFAYYWGGSRAFTWDRSARGGRGRFRFDANFFPRKSAVSVPLVFPGSGVIPLCNANYGRPCLGRFPPFTGRRIAAGDLDHDGRLDVAVLSDRQVLVDGVPTSSLQVGLRKFDYAIGSELTDLGPRLTALGLDLRGDALAIGRTGFPDGNAFGSIVTARGLPGLGSSLTLLAFDAPGGSLRVQDVTREALPQADASESFEASELQLRDVDADGDSDLVLVSPAVRSGSQSALRILRNCDIGGRKGVFRREFDPLTDAAATSFEHFEGDALAVGDVTGDGLLDLVVSRASSLTPGSATRILATQR